VDVHPFATDGETFALTVGLDPGIMVDVPLDTSTIEGARAMVERAFAAHGAPAPATAGSGAGAAGAGGGGSAGAADPVANAGAVAGKKAPSEGARKRVKVK
jgi:hypothetical protein